MTPSAEGYESAGRGDVVLALGRTDRIDPANVQPLSSPWRTAALPVVTFFGLVLPICLLIQLDQYLFYLTPSELLPTYGTAFLLLAAPALPWWIFSCALLIALRRQRRTRTPQRAFEFTLINLAAAEIAAAVLYSTLMWLRTFGLLTQTSPGIRFALFAIAVGALVSATKGGRRLLLRSSVLATWGTAAGALSVLSVPFFGWNWGAGTIHIQNSRPRSVDSSSRPNIVLLTIDALSADHMSVYGAARPTTPMLEQLARTATTFTRAYANGNFTTPGVTSIMTGTRPWTHRALQLPGWPRHEARLESLPALLDRTGYRTGYVSTNSLAGAAKLGLASYFDFASHDRTRGFSACNDAFSTVLKYACAADELVPFKAYEKFDLARLERFHDLENDPRLATRSALDWLATVHKDRPVFLWVHLLPPHSPYAAPAPWLGRFDPSEGARDLTDSRPAWAYVASTLSSSRVRTLEARYDESIAYVDQYAGEFLRQAQRLLGNNTVIVVTADHGESFGHGYGAHTGPGLYDEIIHIPLIIKLPGQTMGKRSDMLAEQVDIAPTLAEIAGLAPPSSWEGRSLLGVCAATSSVTREPDKPAFSMNFEENPRLAALTTGSVAVIDEDWKLIHYLGKLRYPFMPPLHDELYDLAADPLETKNRITDEPGEAERLRRLIDSELAKYGGPIH